MNSIRSIYVRRDSSQCAINRAKPDRCVNAHQSTSIAHLTGKRGQKALSWLLGLALICGSLVWTTQPVAAQSYQIFMPLAATDATPTGLSGEQSECDLNDQEAAIAQFMKSDPGQQRDNPVCDPILSQVARGRARDMALRAYFSHTNPDGQGPNLLARKAGFELPDWYSKDEDANNIESIGGGYQTAEAAWQGWLNSPDHRKHVLGTDQFYADQNSYGIGYYTSPDSPFKFYWVFISAPTPDQQ